MNDYVIRFTLKEDDVSYKQLLGIIREAIEEGAEPSGWYILQHGEFNEMQKSMTAERGFINVQFEKLSAEEEEQRKKDRRKLKDIFISPEALEELRNWQVEEKDNGKVIIGSTETPYAHTYPCPICDSAAYEEKQRKLKENSLEAIQDCKNWLPSQEQADAIWGPELEFDGKLVRVPESIQNQIIPQSGNLSNLLGIFPSSINYTFNPDENFTESVTMEPEGKMWVTPQPQEVFLGNVKHEPILEEIYKGLGIPND